MAIDGNEITRCDELGHCPHAAPDPNCEAPDGHKRTIAVCCRCQEKVRIHGIK